MTKETLQKCSKRLLKQVADLSSEEEASIDECATMLVNLISLCENMAEYYTDGKNTVKNTSSKYLDIIVCNRDRDLYTKCYYEFTGTRIAFGPKLYIGPDIFRLRRNRICHNMATYFVFNKVDIDDISFAWLMYICKLISKDFGCENSAVTPEVFRKVIVACYRRFEYGQVRWDVK